MSGSRMSGHARRAVACSVVLVAAFLPAVARADDNPPVISQVSVSPTALPSSGGTIAISAYITDDIGVTDVFAEVRDANGGHSETALSSSDGFDYSGSYEISPNYTDVPAVYTVTVHARDTGNAEVQQTAADQVTVAADQPPTATDPSVSPRSLPAAGGAVALGVTATDDKELNAFATITLPGGTTQFVNLDSGGSTRFTGTFTAPANTTSSPAQYGVTFTAQDHVGHSTTVDAGTFTVAAKAPPPTTGRLTVRPGRVSFGSVQLGRSARQSVSITNSGARGTASVKGTLTIAGGPGFSLVGAGRSGLAFTLAPGQTRVVTVQFAPTALGARTGSMRVTRADGGQAGLAVGLSGTGVRRR